MTVETLVLGYCSENCYVVYDEDRRALIIDPGDEAPRIVSFVEERGLTVEAVVLTHAHFDHLMAVKEVKEHTGAPLLIHEADARILNDPAYTLVAFPYKLTPDRLLHEGDTVTVGMMNFTVLHTPGHTEGCICLLGEDVLFAGDTLFAGSVGRVDLPGADRNKQQQTLKRLATLPDHLRVLSGHGPSTVLGTEKRVNPFMLGL